MTVHVSGEFIYSLWNVMASTLMMQSDWRQLPVIYRRVHLWSTQGWVQHPERPA